MIGRNVRIATAALFALAPAAESRACSFCNRPAPAAAVTTFRPVYAAAPVAAATVNYMPVTGYRTFYAPTAVTTLQPAAACNACGGATTVMRPVVTYAMRPQLVPYTTYQAVATPVVAAMPVAAAPACSACSAGYAPVATTSFSPGVTASYAAPMPSMPVAPTYAPSAPSCGCSAASGPPVSAYSAAPAAVGSTISSFPAPQYGAPSYAAQPYGGPTAPGQTYSGQPYNGASAAGAPANGANIAPSLSPTQAVPPPTGATFNAAPSSAPLGAAPGSASAAGAPYGQPAPGTTFASPSNSLYGPAAGAPSAAAPPASAGYGPTVVPGTTIVAPVPAPPPPAAAALGQPTIVTPQPTPATPGAAPPSVGPESRLVPNSVGPTAPRETFKEEAQEPLQPGTTRWTPRRPIPLPSDDNTGSSSQPKDGGNGSGSAPGENPAGSSNGDGARSPQNTNFRQPKPYDPDDRMASRGAIRQTTVYPAVYTTPAPATGEDGGWHAAYSRP